MIIKKESSKHLPKTIVSFFTKKKEKEVIHPQVPLRIPCDDLTHLTDSRFGAFTQCGSSKNCSVGLTGGVCKEQGHIHRTMLTSDY
jgi:hypothetical protein